MSEFIVILVTTSSIKEADRISKVLVEKRLAACVNIIKDIRSIFFWKGKLSDEKEVLLIAKSKKKNFEKIEKEVKRLHSYEVPEIIGLPILMGSEDYLDWVEKEADKGF
jgi:periplasmic divalent cation tolerance protein